MTPREIIAEAWAITTREAQLRRWSFFSSLLETLLSVKLIGYQAYFFYEHFFGHGNAGFFDIEVALYNMLPFWLFATIIGIFGLMVVIEFFAPHLCLGAIIGLAAKSYRGEKVQGGLVLGLYNFFPIFAIHEFLTLSSLSLLVTIISLTMRYVEGPMRTIAITMAVILFLFSGLLKFFFSFAEEGVVTQKLGIFTAMGKSFKLIVSHLSHIVFILLLLFVITLRIVVNAVMVIVIPGLVVGLSLLLSFIFPDVVSYSIAGLVGVGLIVGASYMFAYIHAFKVTVWTLTYLELIKHKDLDVIMGSKDL